MEPEGRCGNRETATEVRSSGGVRLEGLERVAVLGGSWWPAGGPTSMLWGRWEGGVMSPG